MKTFVIAGTSEQANQWVKQNITDYATTHGTWRSLSDYVIVSGPEKIRGCKDPHGVFIGTWKERKDILEIVQTLLHCSTHVNTALAKVHRDIRPTPRYTGKGMTYNQAVAQAADLMAKEIDAEVLRSITQKINGGSI